VLLAQLRAPIVAQAAGAPQRPRLISLDFKDADINNILRILAEFSGLNIVTSDDVKGKVTVKLQNVPWQQALDSVVRAAKLAYVQEGNIIRVDKLENLTKEAGRRSRPSSARSRSSSAGRKPISGSPSRSARRPWPARTSMSSARCSRTSWCR
jgi:type II secretory pathway component GspD/PulD (secretin)